MDHVIKLSETDIKASGILETCFVLDLGQLPEYRSQIDWDQQIQHVQQGKEIRRSCIDYQMTALTCGPALFYRTYQL